LMLSSFLMVSILCVKKLTKLLGNVLR
jgi:hypothetical protein